MTNDILKKLSLVGNDLEGFSLEMVKMFYDEYFSTFFVILILKRLIYNGTSMSRMVQLLLPWVSLVILFIFSISCPSGKYEIRAEGNPMVAKAIDEVLKEHTKALMSIPGVVGTGQGLCDGNPCIKVFVIKKTLELAQKIPNTLEGYQVVLVETGEIKALPRNQEGR